MWPFLLKYPKNRIAVIDEVCMVHPSKKLSGQSIYSSGAPYDQRVEEARREAQFGYTRAAVRRLVSARGKERATHDVALPPGSGDECTCSGIGPLLAH